MDLAFIRPNTVNVDLSSSPIALDASGTGTHVKTSPSDFPYMITIPINFTTVWDPNGLAISADVSGSIVAISTLPEPASVLFLASIAADAGSVIRRRR